MTEPEYEAARARLNELETASEQLRVAGNDALQQAQACNEAARVARKKREALDNEANQLRPQLKQFERERSAKKRDEEAAAKAREQQSLADKDAELAVHKAEIDKLKAELAAKG